MTDIRANSAGKMTVKQRKVTDLTGGSALTEHSHNILENEPVDASLTEHGFNWRDNSARQSNTVRLGQPAAKAKARIGPGNHRLQRELTDNICRIERHLFDSPDTLEDREILEMVLHFALAGRDTRPIARALLSKYNSCGGTIAAPARELMVTRGLGKKGVAALKLIQASTVNVLRQEIAVEPVITSWDQLIDYLSIILRHERIEHFYVLFLNERGAVIASEAQGRGTINRVAVYPREIVRRCLELHATSLIIVHNHPSGDVTPSRDDVFITKEVERAAATMGITLHDHVIVGRFGFRSFRQEKLI